jgi:hypothetical protein
MADDQWLMAQAQCLQSAAQGLQQSTGWLQQGLGQWCGSGEWEGYVVLRRGRLTGGRVFPPTPTEKAEQAAERLLDRYLTPQQWNDLKHYGWFDVEGKFRRRLHRTRTRRFRIFWAGPQVHELKANGTEQHYCILMLESVPIADKMLALKLLIEADVNKFLETANRIGAPR